MLNKKGQPEVEYVNSQIQLTISIQCLPFEVDVIDYEEILKCRESVCDIIDSIGIK